MNYACPKEQKLADALRTAIEEAVAADNIDPDRISEIAADWFGVPPIKPAGIFEGDGINGEIGLTIRGRGRLRATAGLTTAGATVRIDCDRNHEFWAELSITVRELASLLAGRAECQIPIAEPVAYNHSLVWLAKNYLGFSDRQIKQHGDSDECLAGAMSVRIEKIRERIPKTCQAWIVYAQHDGEIIDKVFYGPDCDEAHVRAAESGNYPEGVGFRKEED